MRNGLLKVLILLDDTGIRELNDGKSVEGKSCEFLLYVDYNNDTNDTPSASLYIAAEWLRRGRAAGKTKDEVLKRIFRVM